MPSCEEIKKYSNYLYSRKIDHGVVTNSENVQYFPPKLHNTLGKKPNGRVHIDIGCCTYHLMLDKKWAKDFIKFIKGERKGATPPNSKI